MKKIKNPVTVADHLNNKMVDNYIKEKEQPKDESKEVKEGGELFTKGEWVRRDLEIIGPYGSNKHICEITGNFMDEKEAAANAALIAQSKNMYHILKKIVEWDGERIYIPHLSEAKEILQKATPKK